MKIHMVKSGDSMYTIAHKYGVDLEQLIAFNSQISNPDQIDVGMKVKIPVAVVHGGHSGVEYAEKHVVVQGDSLWKISKAWGLSLKEMVDANPQLKNPSVLLTGEVVNIPVQTAPLANTPMMNPTHDFANMSGLGNGGALAPMMNTISPQNVPQPVENVLQLPANVPQILDNIPELIAPLQVPVTLPEKLPEAPQLPQIISQAEVQPPKVQPEPKKESIEYYSSTENLFAQFNVPAIEVQGKQEQPESFQMPEYAVMPQWPMTSPYSGEQPMTYTSPYTNEPPMTYSSPYANEQPLTNPYYSYYAPTPKADCGCGCGGPKNIGPYFQAESPYPSMPDYYAPYSTPYSMPYAMPQFMQPVMPYSMPQPMQPMMPYSMPQSMQPVMLDSMQKPMEMQPPMQQPISMEYPQWNPYAINTAFPPSNMMYPTAQSLSPYYGYMSPCYPITPPAEMSYLHGMQPPFSPYPEQMSTPFKGIEERVEHQSSKEQEQQQEQEQEQEQDTPKEATVEVSSKKIKVPRKSSKNNSQGLDDRVILHNFLQQQSTNRDSFREIKSNEPWMNR